MRMLLTSNMMTRHAELKGEAVNAVELGAVEVMAPLGVLQASKLKGEEMLASPQLGMSSISVSMMSMSWSVGLVGRP